MKKLKPAIKRVRVPLPRQTGGAHQLTPPLRPWRKRKHKGKDEQWQ